MEYPKINSLWKRDQFETGKPRGTHGALIPGEYSEEAFGSINLWDVDEKIDGTNIRIYYRDGKVDIKGRTENSQLPPHLLRYLQETFTEFCLSRAFPCEADKPYPNIILYGEGYGPKIQSAGGNYRSEAGFILFDIYANGWWLQREDVESLANTLGLPCTPYIGKMTEYQIIEFVKSKPLSRCSRIPQMMEGVIARSSPLLLFRSGKPVMFKLKCKEFE